MRVARHGGGAAAAADPTNAKLVEALERKVGELEERSRALELERERLEGGLAARQAEVARLSKLLEDDLVDGVAADRLVAQSARATGHKIVEQLNSQVRAGRQRCWSAGTVRGVSLSLSVSPPLRCRWTS